jgi:hypothetical protein
MLWNTLDSKTQPAIAEFAQPLGTRHSTMSSLRERRKRLATGCLAALLGLSASAVLAQNYVPAIVPTASTTLYTSSAVISPGRVAVDKTGNVFFIAVVGSSSTLMEVPAATQTGTNSAPVTLITGLGQYNSKAAVVDALGNLWASTGNQEQENSSDYVDLVEIPALNGIPNTALAGSGITLATADLNHCSSSGTVICTVLNYKLNDSGSVINGPQVLDFTIDTSGNITYIDIGDNNLPSGKLRVAKSNVYSGSGSLLLLTTQDYNAQIAVDGAGNVYYCSPSAAAVSLISAGALTPVGMTATLGAAEITAPTGISGDVYGNLFIAGGAQLSEVPYEGTALNFIDEFGVVSALTNSISNGGVLDQNGNYYYDSNGSSSTKIQQLQINGYNFGSVAVGSIVNPSSTPPAPSLNLYVNVAPSSSISSYFPTGSPTSNTSALYLQSFPYSGTKSFAGGSSYTAATNYTITMNFQPIHPGLLKGSFTPRSSSADDEIINLQGNGVGPEALFFPGTPSLLFTATTTSQTLNAPQGIAVDTYGDIFVADTGNGKVVADCLATTTAAEDGNGSTNNTFCPLSGYANAITQLGTGFVSPVAIALDGAQSLYVLDSAASGTPVTQINGQSVASTALVSATTAFGGTVLSGPMGIAVDGYTNIYIADTGHNRIVKSHQYGAVGTNNVVYIPSTTTFGGTALSGPTGLAVDAFQNLFIADTGNNRVVEYSGTGVASVISTGSITLNVPYSVAVYPSGQLVVSDKTNGVVLVNGSASKVLSFGSAYTTTGAKGVALDATGNIYLSNTGGSQVLEYNVTSPQAIAFPNTADLATSPLNTETVTDEGNASLVLTGLAASNTNFAIDSSSTCTATSTVTTGNSCSVVTKFTPQAVGPLTASVTLTDNQLGYTLNSAPVTSGENEIATFGTNGTQALSLSGTATSSGAPQTITFPAPASPITYTTTPITLSATASSSLPVVFTIVSGPGTISGNSLTVTGVGTIVIAANQAGSVNFSSAPQVTQSIVVTQAPQTITFTPTTPLIYTTASITLTATSTSGLTPSFTLVSGPGTLSANSLTFTGVGTIVVSATQAGNANYLAATPVQALIVVTPVGTVFTPTFSFPGGTYNVAHVSTLSITDGTPGAAIYYTLNGTTPTTSSSLYSATNPINLTGTETVEAIAVLTGYTPSSVTSATYIVDTTAETLNTTLSPTSLTLAPGASGTINITIMPQNGINATISFLCEGLPTGGTCAFNPSTVTTGPTQATVSTVLTVTAPTVVGAVPQNRFPFLPGATLAAAACLFGWRKRRGLKIVLLLAALSVGLGLASGCGSSNSQQTSTVTVAISGDSVRNTATFTLNY